MCRKSIIIIFKYNVLTKIAACGVSTIVIERLVLSKLLPLPQFSHQMTNMLNQDRPQTMPSSSMTTTTKRHKKSKSHKKKNKLKSRMSLTKRKRMAVLILRLFTTIIGSTITRRHLHPRFQNSLNLDQNL